MNPEAPKFNKREEEQSPNTMEMSPEDFQEMLDQIPALKEMLGERESRLELLKSNPNANSDEIESLEIEITELREEISAREEEL